ncbi:DUF4123 domain-containing protein [Vibrio sp. TBV020]|uniref:DUF4123 domain-containing protein n=1 Tax=Vibrio sp. TBV020 TaxID=3137398 RepID=UPI0038CD9EA6
MLSDWLKSYESGTYWLADNHAHKCAVEIHGFGFNDAVPLFSGPMFESTLSLSPWLIPVSNEVLSIDDKVLNLGIGLNSSAEMSDVLAHLRSLLLASYQGEDVVFRYYDKSVIGPMLSVMNQSEVNHLLGNIDEVALADESLNRYSNNSQEEFALKEGVWWKVQERHLKPLYNVNLHAKSIERRWWNLLPQMMERLTAPEMVISGALTRAKTKGYDPEQWEACALIEVSTKTETHLSELSQPFQLTFEELKSLEKIKEAWI